MTPNGWLQIGVSAAALAFDFRSTPLPGHANCVAGLWSVFNDSLRPMPLPLECRPRQ